MAFTLVHRIPSFAEYTALRRSVDWPLFSEESVTKALNNSMFAVVALNEAGEAIGMGRVLGDNAIYFHIQDVIVRIDQQGVGVGQAIMKELLAYVEAHSVQHSNIGLMCSKGREPFYRAHGFIDRPSEKFGNGMIKVVS